MEWLFKRHRVFLNVTAFYLKHRRVLKKCRGVCGKIVFYS